VFTRELQLPVDVELHVDFELRVDVGLRVDFEALLVVGLPGVVRAGAFCFMVKMIKLFCGVEQI
jgi:hypothetical protein